MHMGVSLRRALALCAVIVLAGALVPAPSSAAPQPMPFDAKIVFLHHSTGGVIWDGGVPGWFSAYNTAEGTNYSITELSYPGSPYPWENYPFDYWNIWVGHAGPTAYLGQATLEMLTPQYDVVVFKHCFPVSNIEPDVGGPDVTSPDKTIQNYKAQYNALKTKLHSFPGNRFIIWTGAAKLQTEISEEMALRAKSFFDWVKDDWDEAGDNIYVWDFYTLETGGGIYLKPENGSADSHPSAAFAAAVAPLFCQRVVKVVQGNGDSPDTADVPGSDGLSLALAGANPTAGPVTLRLSLPEAAHVQLAIYDTAGRRVALVTEGDSPAGQQVLVWNNRAQNVTSGVYFARLRAGQHEVTRRLVILD
jgi:hypothetical protein